MYRFTPEKNGSVAKSISIGLFLAAAVLFVSPTLIELPYKSFWQIGALVLFAVSIALLTRFVFKRFCYEIVERDDGELDFTVTELQGRGRITVCRVAVSNIERVTVIKRGEKLSREDKAGRRTFSYLPDLLVPEQCAIFVTECGEKLIIKIAPDYTLMKVLGGRE